MKPYTIYWRSGDAQVIHGDDPTDAFRRAGIGAGAMPAVDFWDNGDSRALYEWDAKEREWKKV